MGMKYERFAVFAGPIIGTQTAAQRMLKRTRTTPSLIVWSDAALQAVEALRNAARVCVMEPATRAARAH